MSPKESGLRLDHVRFRAEADLPARLAFEILADRAERGETDIKYSAVLLKKDVDIFRLLPFRCRDRFVPLEFLPYMLAHFQTVLNRDKKYPVKEESFKSQRRRREM